MKINEQNLENFANLSTCARIGLTPILVTSSLPCALVFFAAQVGTSLVLNEIKNYNFIELENQGNCMKKFLNIPSLKF